MLVLAAQAILIMIWGVKLDSRVNAIENRGSPQVENIERRLSLFEERQRIVIQSLKENSIKLDAISEALQRHELGSKPNR